MRAVQLPNEMHVKISGVIGPESTILKSAMMPVKLVCRRVGSESARAAGGAREMENGGEEGGRGRSVDPLLQTHTVLLKTCQVCDVFR